MRNAYNILFGKPEGKIPIGGSRHTWEDIIRTDLREVGMGRYGLDASGSGYEQLTDSCEQENEPSDAIKGREFLD
jgi:hypothetical protein